MRLLILAFLLAACGRKDDRLDDVLPAARHFAARASHGAYRPLAPARNDRASTELPLGALARFERAGRHADSFAVYLAAGEPRLARQMLAGRDGAEADVDRAALALAEGDAEAALHACDAALAASPKLPAAAWNRALALADLGLDASAAAGFEAIAAAGEPGWSDEARLRAAGLRDGLERREAAWTDTLTAGAAMVAGGPPLPAELAAAVPGSARLHLLDALRTAEDAERVRALLPLARQVGFGTRAERLLARDLAARAPLARAYRELAGAKERGDGAELLARLAGEPDLRLGAIVLLRQQAARIDELARLAGEEDDPWFELLVTLERARILRKTDPLAAQLALARAGESCHTPQRCLTIDWELATTAEQNGDLDLAERAVARLRSRVRTEGMWTYEQRVVGLVAELARQRGAWSLSRAAQEELILRLPAESCAAISTARLELVAISLLRLEVDRARAELAAVPRCAGRPTDVLRASLAAELVWLGRDGRGDLDAALAEIDRLRQQERDAFSQAHADYLEGRARIRSQRARGVALLSQVLGLGADSFEARQRLAFVSHTLVLEALVHGDAAVALALATRELGVPVPDRCALVPLLEHDRLGVIHVSADGRIGSDHRRLARAWEVDGVLDEAASSALAGCASVRVLVRPPLAGRPGLLPDALAWSQVIGPAGPASTLPPRHLVVADVEPPAGLGLPRLAPWSGRADQLLRGSQATPASVLAALAEATLIEMHVHGRLAAGVSDTAHLVLSPDAGGDFALTAGELGGVKLRGAPVVVLAACEAARVAAHAHQPTSLPLAFLRAGARAVIAATVAVPDDEAAGFFAAVARRIGRGEAPAQAVRDERLARGGGRGGWMSQVIVFE